MRKQVLPWYRDIMFDYFISLLVGQLYLRKIKCMAKSVQMIGGGESPRLRVHPHFTYQLTPRMDSRVWSRPVIPFHRSWVSTRRPLSDRTYRFFTARYVKIPIIRMNDFSSIMLLLSKNLLSKRNRVCWKNGNKRLVAWDNVECF